MYFHGSQGQVRYAYILLYHSQITASIVEQGVSNDTKWTGKTSDEILKDINGALSSVYEQSNGVEVANTILLPHASYSYLVQTRVGDTDKTVLKFIQENNIHKMRTGQDILIRGVFGLEKAGAGNTGRMVTYRRDPAVLKLYIPMPYKALELYKSGPLRWDVPVIFRLGGLDIRRPGAFKYFDGI